MGSGHVGENALYYIPVCNEFIRRAVCFSKVLGKHSKTCRASITTTLTCMVQFHFFSRSNAATPRVRGEHKLKLKISALDTLFTLSLPGEFSFTTMVSQNPITARSKLNIIIPQTSERATSMKRMQMTSWSPYWYSKPMKRRPCLDHFRKSSQTTDLVKQQISAPGSGE